MEEKMDQRKAVGTDGQHQLIENACEKCENINCDTVNKSDCDSCIMTTSYSLPKKKAWNPNH